MKKLIHQSIAITAFIMTCILLYACQPATAPAIVADEAGIEEYLDTRVMEPAFGGKVFSAHKVLMTDDQKIYIWAYMQEYYKKAGRIEPGTGWSVPMVLNIKKTDGVLEITGHETSGDGEQYAADIRNLFPDKIQKEIFDFTGSDDMRKLEKISVERSATL